MDLKSVEEIKTDWGLLLKKIESHFGVDPDLQGILFLIGVQELGVGFRNFSKSEKQDLMHIATCRLMSFYGYYLLKGQDSDGWPHWELVEQIPVLSLKEQDLILKKSAIRYFKELDFI
ncbi:MAG: hypothetical protein ACKOYC_07520 [Bacteroidota bacterium]